MIGYTTEFEGVLNFASKLSVSELIRLLAILGEDQREHPEWDDQAHRSGWYYLDLSLTEDGTGLEWSGDEKTYCMEDQVAFIIRWMRKVNPGFGLLGKLEARGEDFDDHWFLIAEGTKVTKVARSRGGH